MDQRLQGSVVHHVETPFISTCITSSWHASHVLQSKDQHPSLQLNKDDKKLGVATSAVWGCHRYVLGAFWIPGAHLSGYAFIKPHLGSGGLLRSQSVSIETSSLMVECCFQLPLNRSVSKVCTCTVLQMYCSKASGPSTMETTHSRKTQCTMQAKYGA